MTRPLSRLIKLCVLAASFAAATASAQGYPDKVIKIVVPFGPGGIADLTARLVAQRMSDSMKQPVIIDNRPSAGGIVAADVVAKADPDGYTLLLISNGTAVSAGLFKSLPYDTMNDFVPISTLGTFDLAVIASGKTKFSNMGELLAYAKANPGKLNMGTINKGSTQHLAAELLTSMAGIKALLIPYKRTPDVMTALTTNEIDFAVEILGPTLPQVKAGNARVLGVTASKRFAGMPDVPTVAESGVPGYEATSWNGLAAPAKTPKAIIDKLNQEIVKAVQHPDVQKRFLELGVTAQSNTPEGTRKLLESDIGKWTAVIEKAGIERQ